MGFGWEEGKVLLKQKLIKVTDEIEGKNRKFSNSWRLQYLPSITDETTRQKISKDIGYPAT